MNVLSIILLLVTATFAITLGIWYGRSLVKSKQSNQNKLIAEQQRVKYKRINDVESFINKHGRITNRDVQELLDVSRATAERYLDHLEDEKVIVQRGAGRGAHYVKR